MAEMNIDAVDQELVVVEGIYPRLGLSPIKVMLPVCCKFLEV